MQNFVMKNNFDFIKFLLIGYTYFVVCLCTFADENKQNSMVVSVKNEAAVSKEEHTVTWSKWAPSKSEAVTANDIEVFVDGHSIKHGDMAISILNLWKFPAGSKINIVIPQPENGNYNSEIMSFLHRTYMLQNWIDDGAEIVFSDGKKPLDWHTLFFRNIRPSLTKIDNFTLPTPYNGKYSPDTAVFYLDGVKYPDGPSAVEALKKIKFDKDSVLVTLVPKDYVGPNKRIELCEPSVISDYIDKLQRETKMTKLLIGAWSIGYYGP